MNQKKWTDGKMDGWRKMGYRRQMYGDDDDSNDDDDDNNGNNDDDDDDDGNNEDANLPRDKFI